MPLSLLPPSEESASPVDYCGEALQLHYHRRSLEGREARLLPEHHSNSVDLVLKSFAKTRLSAFVNTFGQRFATNLILDGRRAVSQSFSNRAHQIRENRAPPSRTHRYRVKAPAPSAILHPNITSIPGALKRRKAEQKKAKPVQTEVKPTAKAQRVLKLLRGGRRKRQQSMLERRYKAIHSFNGSVCQSVKLNYLSRQMLSKFLCSKYPEHFVAWLLNFMMVPPVVKIQTFQALEAMLKQLPETLRALATFLLFDLDRDGVVSERDLFRTIHEEGGEGRQQDLVNLVGWSKRPVQSTRSFKIQHILLADLSLNYNDFKAYYRKVDQPFIVTDVKKNTAFHRSVAVLDHRLEVRFQRKALEEEKHRLEGVLRVNQAQPQQSTQKDISLTYPKFFAALSGKYFTFEQLIRVLFQS